MYDIHILMYVCVYVYIYIERERERDRYIDVCMLIWFSMLASGGGCAPPESFRRTRLRQVKANKG